MKITESQLRRIIREEIIKESNDFEIPADMQSMSDVEFRKFFNNAEDKASENWNEFYTKNKSVWDEDSRRGQVRSRNESDRQKAAVMAVLGTGYPKAEKRIDMSDQGSVYSLSHLSKQTPAKMKQFLDAMVVHGVLNDIGPDINYDVILRKLPLIRKKLAGVSILDAHETNRKSLLSAMEAAGLFGRSSDQLRASADRIYNPFRI